MSGPPVDIPLMHNLYRTPVPSKSNRDAEKRKCPLYRHGEL